MSRTKEGRDALRSSEAHPQAGSIAPPWSKRSQRRVPISRHRPKSPETGEAHPSSGADLRHMRRRRPSLSLPNLRWANLCFQRDEFFNGIRRFETSPKRFKCANSGHRPTAKSNQRTLDSAIWTDESFPLGEKVSNGRHTFEEPSKCRETFGG